MKFAELLKSKDMTGARLSRAIKTSRFTVSKWTHGVSMPSVGIAVKIAKALETDLETVANSLLETVENK